MVAANNAIYNTVGASISGVTNTLTVTNLSNTASSAARETIVVGGGTAGDPTINWNVSGVTNFEMGLDNSDSDKLKISQGTSLGTNDTWIMDTSGRRTMPLQPCFFAYLTVNVPNVTGDSSSYSVICDAEQFDAGSNYSTVTGKFTAPINGNYYFTFTLFVNNLAAANSLGTVRFEANTAYAPFGLRCNVGAIRDFVNACTMSASAVIKLAAGDTVNPIIEVVGAAKVVGIGGSALAAVPITHFSGYLVS